MKIELEYPYNQYWKNGYVINHRKENRKMVVLFNDNYNRTTISYARYLMSVYLERFLDQQEHVDHINEVSTDDRLDNLQLLSQQENNRKSSNIRQPAKWVELKCANCGASFYRRHKNYINKIKNGQTNFYCCKKCIPKNTKGLVEERKKNKLSKEDIDYIKELRSQGFSSYKIHDLTGFSRNTIMKYW